MAVRFDASADALYRTASLPTITSFTIMGWFNVITNRSAYSTFMEYGLFDGGTWYNLSTNATGGTTVTLALTNGSSETLGGTLTVGTWAHLAMTVSGTGAGQNLVYRNGVLNITGAGSSSPTAVRLYIGSNSIGEWLNGRAAAVKIWSAALTANEILNEMVQYMPVRTTNLNGFYPFFTSTDLKDYGGGATTWTVGGTLTSEDGPPIPWVVMPPRRRTATAAAGGNILPQMMQHMGA